MLPLMGSKVIALGPAGDCELTLGEISLGLLGLNQLYPVLTLPDVLL